MIKFRGIIQSQFFDAPSLKPFGNLLPIQYFALHRYYTAMKIEHLAIWVNDIEAMKAFYVTYFGMACNDKYTNPKKQFESYFLSLADGAARIELMRRPGILPNTGHNNTAIGLAHFAIALASKEEVNALTERLRADGYTIASEPRTTGDGYYESAVLDPEGNYVEITV